MSPPLTRRTVAKLTGIAAAGVSALLGWLFEGYRLDGDVEGEDDRQTTPRADLPPPKTAPGTKGVAEAIADRRSRREYADDPISAAELGQLLWAAQGHTKRNIGGSNFRAAPSAGATFPLEVFVVIGQPGVSGIESGIYRYRPGDHELDRRAAGDFQAELQDSAVDQAWVGEAALDIVVTAIDERTTERYGERGRRRYVPMEAGHVGQNIYLQAESLGLSTVAIGAFSDGDLRELLGVSEDYRPLYVFPVGRRA
ncbi:MAG: SagB/ThcOx family dehydrogenase [Halodesulfurarchaeum sp.]